MRKWIAVVLLIASAITISACSSNADKASKNISTEAEQFKVQRRIVGINGITDKVEFEVEGRCSVEYGASLPRTLDVICKQGPNDYRKHYIGLSDNIFWISTQLKGINVSVYRTKIILKPQNIVPDLDLVTG
jgi:ABC-type Fe3+-hydroxamate transport system substrate-binding protein